MARASGITVGGVTYSVTPPVPSTTHVETCIHCDGTGRLYGRTCRGCGGRGLITVAGAGSIPDASGDSSAGEPTGSK